MATTISSISVERFKSQAKKLKESLAKNGTELSHSAALEAIAAIHGFKDWNVASAKAKDELKLFVVCCSCDPTPSSHDESTIEFQYILRAKSALDVERTCAEEFPKFLASNSFEKGQEIEIQDIFEIDEISERGTIMGWVKIKAGLVSGHPSKDRLGHALPIGKRDCKIKYHFWSKEEELQEKNAPLTFVKL